MLKLLSGLLSIAAIALGYAWFVIFSPVTPTLLEPRLQQVCYVGMQAMGNESAYLRGQVSKVESIWRSCGCMASQLVKTLGPKEAVHFGETLRRALVFRVNASISGRREPLPAADAEMLRQAMPLAEKIGAACP